MPEQIMGPLEIAAAITDIAAALCNRGGEGPFAVIGIRRGGEHLARRLAAELAKKTGKTAPLGMVDITLYRDDGFGPHDWPEVGVTQIDFRLKDYTVVLVDDVLFTGRTVRAALDAILDYGRPKAVRLAVLIDRGHRELPIQADVVGRTLVTNLNQRVDVVLREAGAESDAVIVDNRDLGGR
ncbi:MAG: bifunctional pyr operon transcriptional regulator/uracil phosphoribosyltransferase PyrR [Myxococcota bacterium]